MHSLIENCILLRIIEDSIWVLDIVKLFGVGVVKELGHIIIIVPKWVEDLL